MPVEMKKYLGRGGGRGYIKNFLINLVIILMMSAKLATPGLLKIMVF